MLYVAEKKSLPLPCAFAAATVPVPSVRCSCSSHESSVLSARPRSIATATVLTSGPEGVDALRRMPTSRMKPLAGVPLAGARCSAASVLCHAKAAAGQLAAVLSTAEKL